MQREAIERRFSQLAKNNSHSAHMEVAENPLISEVPGLCRVFLRSDGMTVYDTLSLSSTPIREFFE